MGRVEGEERGAKSLNTEPHPPPPHDESQSRKRLLLLHNVSRDCQPPLFLGSLVSPHHCDAGRARTQAARLFLRATKTSCVVSGERDGCSTSSPILPSSPPTCPDAIMRREGWEFGPKFVIRESSSRGGRRQGKRFESCVP